MSLGSGAGTLLKLDLNTGCGVNVAPGSLLDPSHRISAKEFESWLMEITSTCSVATCCRQSPPETRIFCSLRRAALDDHDDGTETAALDSDGSLNELHPTCSQPSSHLQMAGSQRSASDKQALDHWSSHHRATVGSDQKESPRRAGMDPWIESGGMR